MNVEIGQYNSNLEDEHEFTVFSDNFWIHEDYVMSEEGVPHNDVCVIKVFG